MGGPPPPPCWGAPDGPPLYPTNAVGEVLREWAGEVPALLAASLSSRAESDLESCVGDDGREKFCGVGVSMGIGPGPSGRGI